MKYKKLNEVLIEWNESSKEDSANTFINQKDIKESFTEYKMYNLDDDEDCEILRNTIRGLSIPIHYYDEEEDEWVENYEKFHLFGDLFRGYSYWGTGEEESLGPFTDRPYEWMKKDTPQNILPQGYWEFLAKEYNKLEDGSEEKEECESFCDLLSSVTFTFDGDPVMANTDGETDIPEFFTYNNWKCITRIEDGWGYNYLYQGAGDTRDLVYIFKSKKYKNIFIQFLAYGIPPRS